MFVDKARYGNQGIVYLRHHDNAYFEENQELARRRVIESDEMRQNNKPHKKKDDKHGIY